MDYIVVVIFIIGYLAIVLEPLILIDKSISALMMSTICWGIISFFNLPIDDKSIDFLKNVSNNSFYIEKSLLYHLGKSSEIFIFLICAMSIVEIIDMFSGFDILKTFIKTKSKLKLLWILSLMSFFLSAIIDNMTSVIVLITFLKKIINDRKIRIYYTCIMIIAANAGGVWSPIGDITTTMLWISNKVTSLRLINNVFIPSFLCMLVPTVISSFMPVFNGNISLKKYHNYDTTQNIKDQKISIVVLLLGFFLMFLVPIFKQLTSLPPYMGMIFSFSILCISVSYMKILFKKKIKSINNFSIYRAISRIEFSSILFFLGILLSVGALDSLGFLFKLANYIKIVFPFQSVVVVMLGLMSSIIDNVPLVAASLSLFKEAINHKVWHFIAYSSGTGGSILIIGSAAGIAAMGIEKISFFWYLKNISWLALIGYLVGFFLAIAIMWKPNSYYLYHIMENLFIYFGSDTFFS